MDAKWRKHMVSALFFPSAFCLVKRRFKTTILLLILLFTCIFYFSNNPEYSTPNNPRFDVFVGKQILEKPLKCPELTPEDFISSYGIPNSKIAIIAPILYFENYENYIGIDTLKCYAIHFGYQLHLINMTDNPNFEANCTQSDYFFRRHCIIANFLEENEHQIEYALIIDADIGIINPCHTIQEYIDFDERVEIIFYERYYNDEISAASYFIRNSNYSRTFMHFWADYYFRLPKSFHGTDNGAIHQVFMEYHFTTEKQKFQCYNLWNTSQNFNDLFVFEACTKNALNISQTLFANNRIKLIRKLSPGWVRDGWLTGTKWSPNDFMLHGWKKSKLSYLPFFGWRVWRWPFLLEKFDLKKCIYQNSDFPNFKYLSKFVSTNEKVAKLLTEKVKEINETYNQILIDTKLL